MQLLIVQFLITASDINLGSTTFREVIFFLANFIIKLFSDFGNENSLGNKIPNEWSKQNIRQEVPNAAGIGDQVNDGESLLWLIWSSQSHFRLLINGFGVV